MNHLELLDWIVLGTTLFFIVAYGTYKTRKNSSVTDFIKGGNDTKWWTIGLSVMATQASAITFLSTPGQAFHSGMGLCTVLLRIANCNGNYLFGIYSNLPSIKSIYCV